MSKFMNKAMSMISVNMALVFSICLTVLYVKPDLTNNEVGFLLITSIAITLFYGFWLKTCDEMVREQEETLDK